MLLPVKIKTSIDPSSTTLVEKDAIEFFRSVGKGSSVDKDVKTLFRSLSGGKKTISLRQLRKGLQRFITSKRPEAARQKLLKLIQPEQLLAQYEMFLDSSSV